MEIRVLTTVDYEAYKKFHYFYYMKRKRHRYSAVKIILLLSLPNLFLLFSAIKNGFQSFVIPGFVFWGLLLLLALFIIFFTPKLKFSKKRREDNTIYYTYSFNDDKININCISSKFTGDIQVNYSIIKDIYETDGYFYLFVNKRQAYMVCKKGIESGTLDDLQKLLKSKLPPKKYIIRK